MKLISKMLQFLQQFSELPLFFNDTFEFLQLKKSIKPPEMPSKHVRNWVPKVLEQRRHGLELYLQVFQRTFTLTLGMKNV